MLLAEAMPRWHHRERHAARTDAPAHRLLTAAEELTWREVPAFRALMGLRFGGWRGLPADEPVLEWFDHEGFRRVGRTDDELVLGLVRPTHRTDPARAREASSDPGTFRDFTDRGHVKIAFAFHSTDGQLLTETRVVSTDPRSRRLFAAYWLLIRPASGLIRRRWLRAIRTRAERAET